MRRIIMEGLQRAIVSGCLIPRRPMVNVAQLPAFLHSTTGFTRSGLLGVVSSRSLRVHLSTAAKVPTNSYNIQISAATVEKAREVYNTIIENSSKKRNISPITVKHYTVPCEIVELLLHSKVPESHIIDLFPGNTALARYTVSHWQEALSELKHYYFRPSQFLPIIAKCPQLLSSDGGYFKVLHNTLTILRTFNVNEGELQKVVARNPDVLSSNSRHLKFVHSSLLEIFTCSDVTKLIIAHPIVLTASWEETAMKLDYTFNMMGVRDNRQLLKSVGLWRDPLFRLAIRHDFLYRRGMYARPNKRGFGGENNAELREIVDTDDKSFAILVADASEKEFNEFVTSHRRRVETQLKERQATWRQDYMSDDSDDEK